MRAPKFICAAAAALALALPLAAQAVAENVETVPATRVAKAETILDSETTKIASPKSSEAKVSAVEVPKPAIKKAPVLPTLRASINLSSQTMTVSENGNAKYTWKISSGRGGYHTPTGTYRPQWMSRMHYSKKYDNAPMPHSVFFHKGYAVHATYATGALGRPASHGCIRLAPSNAKKFYHLVSKHGKARTRISITGSTPRPTYAKRKKTKRKTYSAGSSYSGYGGYSNYKPAKKTQRRAKYYKQPKKRAPKPSYSYSYFAPKKQMVWPGDR